MKSTTTKIAYFLLFVFVLTQALAGDLIGKPTRPTFFDLLKSKSLDSNNPYRGTFYNQLGVDRKRALKESLPKFIVNMERAFPGAVVACLGRDTSWLADLLEAYHYDNGQKDRVVRLEASGNSISNAQSERQIYDFLVSSGMDIEKIKKGIPFVIVDGTRYNNGSQSRIIMKAAYSYLAKETGLSYEQLIRTVNFVSLAYDGYAYYPNNNWEEIDPNSFLTEQALEKSKSGPKAILAASAWDLTHGYEWTGTYGAFYTDNKGRVFARPGAENSPQVKQYVLYEMIEGVNYVRSDDFRNRLNKYAAKMGVNLNSKERVEIELIKKEEKKEPVANDKSDEIDTKVAEIIKALPVNTDDDYIDQNGMKLTANGHQFLALMKAVPKEILDRVALEVVLVARDEDRLGGRDARRLLRRILSAAKLSDDAYAYLQEQLNDRDVEKFIRKKVLDEEAIDGKELKNAQNNIELAKGYVAPKCKLRL